MFNSLFSDLPSSIPEEHFLTLLKSPHVRIERIVSHGHASSEGFWYDQDQHEWVVLLRGAARLSIAGRVIELNPGDYVNIPAHEKHRVEWTSPDEPTIWLAVHYGELDDIDDKAVI
jgi:cupin 2 domain-containing protein